jgi:hypothetical protein
MIPPPFFSKPYVLSLKQCLQKECHTWNKAESLLQGCSDACPPVTPDRPSRPPDKSIFKHIQIYSRYF